MAVQPFVGLQFHNLFYTDGRTPWTSDQPVARPLPTHRTTQTQNKRTQTSMAWVGLETTIPAFERAKRVHDLDRAVTVSGLLSFAELNAIISTWDSNLRRCHKESAIILVFTPCSSDKPLRFGEHIVSIFPQIVQRYNPEDCTLQAPLREPQIQHSYSKRCVCLQISNFRTYSQYCLNDMD
jgi:hypothetical protein